MFSTAVPGCLTVNNSKTKLQLYQVQRRTERTSLCYRFILFSFLVKQTASVETNHTAI